MQRLIDNLSIFIAAMQILIALQQNTLITIALNALGGDKTNTQVVFGLLVVGGILAFAPALSPWFWLSIVFHVGNIAVLALTRIIASSGNEYIFATGSAVAVVLAIIGMATAGKKQPKEGKNEGITARNASGITRRIGG